MEYQLLNSPWKASLHSLASSVESSLVVAAPYITRAPLNLLTSCLRGKDSVQVKILTNLRVESMVQGYLSPDALCTFRREVPSTSIWHLPGLHAKVYVADKKTAIITSANLTDGGLSYNYEYGIQLSDTVQVSRIADDLDRYGALGSEVSLEELLGIADAVYDLKTRYKDILSTAHEDIKSEYAARVTATNERMMTIRAKSGESTNAIFSRTILYSLTRGSLTTQELHYEIKAIHPDMRDDNIDRVINGMHFGKRWKHQVRSAQSSLKTRGLIRLESGKWTLNGG